jgi:Concanavalin A-like lectin/glucanases superfamily
VPARNDLAFTGFAAFAVCLAGAGWGCTAGPIEIATLPSDSLSNDMVGHWAFDDGPGTVATDSSGNGRTGIVGGMIPSPGSPLPWIPGQFMSAYHFTGADYVTAGGVPRATPSYSVSAWVLIEADELGAPIANLLSTEALGGGWALYATLGPGQQSYDFRFATNPTQGYVIASCACVVPGAWTHLAAVVDADSSTLTLYVGGVATTVPTDGAAILPGSTVLYMARSAVLSPTFPLTGALDDVVIYNRALVAEEVAELSQVPAPNPQ